MKRTVLIVVLSMLMLGATRFRHDEFKSKKNVLRGVVTDQESHEALIGVSIQIDSLGIGALTNIDGRYWIREISPGEYHVKVRYIGYQPIDTTIAIISGTSLRCDFSLTAKLFPIDSNKIIRSH